MKCDRLVTVEPFLRGDDLAVIDFIVAHMRAKDRQEVSLMGATPTVLYDMVARSCDCHVFYLGGNPAFCWGVSRGEGKGLWLWGLGTDDTRKVIPFATRWGMQTWLPDLFATHDVDVIRAVVPVSSIHSINWLQRLGMRETANEAGLVQLTFTRADLQHVHIQATVDAICPGSSGPNEVFSDSTAGD